jgi:hypothetical protein
MLTIRNIAGALIAASLCAASACASATEVRGYTRHDGVQVKPHHRITRDHHGKIKRSHSAKKDFQRTTPCPANGSNHGPCGGYVIDHKIPLACGGADHPSNMQWQTIAEAKKKDRQERKQCGR